ncbi:HU family DNA-binding protein [Gemmiger formicilis]|uniref:HU family DNA-binding protein n=1 Tax=Gemmiger formicilis TaxID=745368 RepID=UPI00195F218A|nr:HU family DNA-binding protein [Gemmiger formicilis]MBM6716421.1 HU family DNA-binding protein [Gemmiger formicilis]
MTRSQLITKVANDSGLSAAQVEKVMDGIFGTIGDVLRDGEKVTIAGFGRFEMRERQTKNFTNPKTKVTSQLKPTAIPGFKASGRLKEKVAK